MGRGQPDPSSQEGIVIGQFGFPASRQQLAFEHRIQVTRLADGKKWMVPFQEEDTSDRGATAPFYMRLPAGRYQVTSWTLVHMHGHEYSDAPSVVFDVTAGQVTCVGALYPLRRGGIDLRNEFPVLVLSRDECAAIEGQFRKAAPEVHAPVQVRLAINPSCPRCRAEPDGARP